MVKQSAINKYRQADSSEASYATPHRLVQKLMSGALDGIANAKGSIMHNQPEQRNSHIQWTMNVIDGLRGALDFEHGGEIAANLDSLYDYMNRRLFDANMHNDIQQLDEVTSLLKEIKGAWDSMPKSLQRADNIKDVVNAP
ncbi:MAG: flagellar export chaperone FliS [Gammaproteobacteria bacterium]|nr:flagellar export chaperone FliS [Gammaproteobacteria bacterium]